MPSPGSNSVLKGLAPPTPLQLSPVKPRRPSAADAQGPLRSDVTALTAELGRLVDSDSTASAPSGKQAGSAAVDWEHLPLDVWDVVWRGLDLTAQMALCLTSTRCALTALLHAVWRTIAFSLLVEVSSAHHCQAAARSACDQPKICWTRDGGASPHQL